jgi:hypothetical protein
MLQGTLSGTESAGSSATSARVNSVLKTLSAVLGHGRNLLGSVGVLRIVFLDYVSDGELRSTGNKYTMFSSRGTPGAML